MRNPHARSAHLLIQAALNGDRNRSDHKAVPMSIEELIRDAIACVRAGAGAIHLHPRDADGRERLDPELVNRVASAVREACGVPVGVSTGAWIEPDLQRRIAMIRAWRTPGYASVNLSEEGAVAVIQALVDAGVGIEAGIGDTREVAILAESGLASRITRVLVEPFDEAVGSDPDRALQCVAAIHRELDRFGIEAPRLQHGDGETTWVILHDALRTGRDTRIGLEDTLDEPGGRRTVGNAALVRAAVRLRGDPE